MKTTHISSDWLDEDETIFVQVYRPGWDWDELFSHMDIIQPLIGQKPHTVNVISIHTSPFFAMKRLLPNIRRITINQPTNIQRVLIVRDESPIQNFVIESIEQIEFLDSSYMLVSSVVTAFTVLQITPDDVRTNILDDIDLNASV
jgi:hypothetical protein